MKPGINVKPARGWTVPRTLDKRRLPARLADGCRAFWTAFRREPARVRITHFSTEFIRGGGGGSARVTQMF